MPRATRHDIEFADRKLTPKSTIIISQWFFHRSARFWDAPDEFRLNRDHNNKTAYIPFGTGPRICVAWSLALLELQILAFEMASALQLTLASPLGPPEPLMITMWPPHIHLEAQPRGVIPTSEHQINRREASSSGVSVPLKHSIDQCPYHSLTKQMN